MNANDQTTVYLPAGQVLTVTAASGVTGSAIRMALQPGGADQSVTPIAGANLTFGPYVGTERFRILCSVGAVTIAAAVPDPQGSVTTASTTTAALAISAGGTIDVDSAAISATGNDTTQSVTASKMSGTVTTGALTTAANASTAVVITLPGVVAGDIVLVTLAGGTNTTSVAIKSAICTTDTITVVLRDDVLITTALNGTVAFHYLWMKA